jgi:RNA polymerase sigma-70 factor (family 1)
MTEINDRTIVAFSQGDPRAFTMIYTHYYSWLFFSAFKYIKSQENAEDILANTFQKLWEDRERFSSVKNLEGYALIMIRNACIDFLRRERLKSRIEHDLTRQMETEAEESFARNRIRAEVIDFVKKEIDKLSPKYKTVFRLSFVEGLKNEEIATQLEISNQLVRVIKSRIHKLLKVKFVEKSLVLVLLLLYKNLLPNFPLLSFL